MAMDKIKFFWKSGLSNLAATSEESGNEVANLLDMLEGTKWKATSPIAQNIDFVAAQLLPNNDFETDTAGWNLASGWARSNARAYSGSWSLASPASGGGATEPHAQYNMVGSSFVAGKTYTIHMWGWSDTANQARLMISLDSMTPAYSSYHTGASAWELLTVSQTATTVSAPHVKCRKEIATGQSYFDLGYVFPGRTADYLAMSGQNFNSIGATIGLAYSSDNFGADSNQAFASYTPTTDLQQVKEFTSFTAPYQRLQITGSLSAAPQAAITIWGPKTELEYPSMPFNPYRTRQIANVNKADTGFLLGINKKYKERIIDLRYNLTNQALFDKIKAWEEGNGLKNFFFAWDTADHPDDVWLARSDPEVTNIPPLGGSSGKIMLALRGRVEE